MKRSRRIFVMPDTHFGDPTTGDGQGGHDEEAFATALKALELFAPDEFIHIGDIGEWGSCSSWQFSKKKRPPLAYILPALKLDIAETNKQMDRIDAVLDHVGCKKRTLIEGNHELWVKDMVGELDLTAEAYAMPKILNLRQRGWKFQPFGKYLKRGKLNLYHGGHYTSVHHAYTHALKCGASVGYGHGHDLQYVTVPSIEGPHCGIAFGCLCLLEKDFTKGRSTNWQHGFGTILMQPNGDFLPQLHRIQDGWSSMNGREIHAGRLVAGRPRALTTLTVTV